MGHTHSHLKVRAEASLGVGLPGVDALTLSYSSARCWGRGRRRIARFTFPRKGWASGQGLRVCRSNEQQHLPLVRLHQEESSTTVKVKCTWHGAPLYVATMPLASLLGLLEEAVAGDTALLHFTLAGGEGAAAQSGVAFAAFSFSRSRYSRPWACGGSICCTDGETWEYVSQGDAACSRPVDGGCGAPAIPDEQRPGQGQRGPAQADCAAKGQEDPDRAELAVPEADLGESSSLALCHSLRTGPVPREEAPPAGGRDTTGPPEYSMDPPNSAKAHETVPEVDLGESSSLALYLSRRTEPVPYEEVPSPSAPAILVVPQPVVWNQPSVATTTQCQECTAGTHPSVPRTWKCQGLIWGSHQFWHCTKLSQSQSQNEEPPASEQAHEAVPGEDQSEPSPSAREAVCPGLGGPWVHAFLDGLAVLHMVGYCLLLLYTAWH